MNRNEGGVFSSLVKRISGMERLEEELKFKDHFSQLPNGYQLQRDFGALKSKSGYDFVMIRLNGIHQMATLFDFRTAERTFLRLCPPLREFGEKWGGRVYRLALDLFGMLFPVADQKAFTDELERLLADLEQVNVQDEYVEYSCHYTFTYGVYPLSHAEDAMESIQAVADITKSALDRLNTGYETAGTVFNEDSKPRWELQGKLRACARQAWESRQFVPYYQLVYSLRSSRPVGAETLTRWEHPSLGMVLPNDFIPVMESEGLIMDLDLYMLEEACKKIKGWVDKELITVPLSVNISKLNIHRKNFVERVIALVESYAVPPVLIELELAESALIFEKNAELLKIMERLHAFGFSLSMDNFASNDFSSINLLRDLQVDVIKVNPHFFANVSLERESRDGTFVRGVVDMAKALGIKLVAMGIETQEQAQLARELGCDFAQGYYFSRPISNEEFEKQIF